MEWNGLHVNEPHQQKVLSLLLNFILFLSKAQEQW